MGGNRKYAAGRAPWRNAACAQITSGRDGRALCYGFACDCWCGQPSAKAFSDERAAAIVGSVTALFLCDDYADRTAYRTAHAKAKAHLCNNDRHFVHSPNASWTYLLYPRTGAGHRQPLLLHGQP